MKKTLSLLFIAILAVSMLSLLASANARPFLNWRNFQSFQNSAHRPVQQSFVRIDGLVDQLTIAESTIPIAIKGVLEAQSRTVVLNNDDLRQGASAKVVWKVIESSSSPQPSPTEIFDETQTIVSTFFTARLIGTGSWTLDTDGKKFELTGNWNINTVTSTFSVTRESEGKIISTTRSQSASVVIDNTAGMLSVNEDGTTFTLTIEGFGILSGSVIRQKISSTQFNAFKVNNDGTNAVTRSDLASIAKAYGSGLGWGNYDQRMDYNFDYKIDITDLTTAAANINRL